MSFVKCACSTGMGTKILLALLGSAMFDLVKIGAGSFSCVHRVLFIVSSGHNSLPSLDVIY